ncbi:cadherin-like domain-containing protein [Cobetia sp. 4B]|nr:cadherin-like domain-containing protein [Cobetia sp. 4B]
MSDNKTPKKLRPALIRSLEPRFLFDGAAVGTAADTATDQDYSVSHGEADHSQQDSMTAEAVAAQSQSPATKALQASQSARQQDEATSDRQSSASDTADDTEKSDTASQASRAVIFVDSNVTNYESLVDELDPEAEVIVLNGEADGVKQMASYLDGQQDISAVHILSHGEEGELSLGTATLDAASMAGEYSDELATIGSALTQEGDILLYACDFSSGGLGLEAATQLANLTGADIASSSDDTGSQALGGDWDLENQTGDIEAVSIAATDWGGKLAATVELDFSATPTLEEGVDRQAGAVYRFSNVADGLDAIVTVDAIANNVTLDVLDENRTGLPTGFISAISSSNPEGFVDYTIDFVDAGTSNSRFISFTATGLDLDNVVESMTYYEANNYKIESGSAVSVTVDPETSSITADGSGNNVPNGRDQTNNMISVGYENVSSFSYRAGVAGPGRYIGALFEEVDTGVPGDINYTAPVTVDLPAARDDFTSTEANTPVTIDPLANDGQGGGSLTISQINGIAIESGGDSISVEGGSVALSADGELIFTPDADYAGTSDFQYTVIDVNGNQSTGQSSVAVITPYESQFSSDGDLFALEAAGVFGALDNYDDLTYTATGLPEGLSINAETGEITGELTADSSANGPYSITVVGTDSQGNQVSDTFDLSVNNPAPVAAADTVTVDEKSPVSGNVLVNDNDGGNDTDNLTVSQVGEDPANVGQPTAGDNGGLFTINSDGSYDFAPGEDFDDLAVNENRTTTISYQVSDGQGGFDTATLNVIVNGTNDAPIVSAPTDDLTANDADEIDIPAGDAFSDVDASDVLSFTATGLPAGLSINQTTGRISGTLASDASQSGPFNIIVTADDGNGGTVTDTILLEVSNIPPEANPDQKTTGENALAVGNVLLNDTSGDNDALVVSQVNGESEGVGQAIAGTQGGEFTVSEDGSYAFIPGADFDDLAVGESRTTTLSYQVSDGQGGVDTATLSVTVTGTNDVPVVSTPTPDATAEDGDAIDIPAGDAFSDVDGSDDLTFTAAGLPDGVTIDPDTGRITGTLTPDASQNGPFEITVTADDGNGGTVTDTFTLTPSNTAPVAQDDAVTVAEKSPASGNVLANDADGGNDTDALAVSQVGEDAANVGQPTAGDNGGQFTVNADGSYDFAPGADFDDLAVGEIRITAISYQVSDGQGGVDTATLSVTVTGTNDVPVVSTPTPDATAEDGDAIDIPAGDAFSDVDGSDDLTFTAAGLPDGVTIDPDTGRITGTLTPDASQNGPFEITVTADDGNGGTVTDTFTLTPSNTAPVAQDDAVTVAEKSPASGNVLANDADGGNDTDALAVSQVGEDAANVGQPTAGDNGGQFTVNADGSYDFAPGADFDDLAVGEIRITAISYQVSDGQGGVDTATLSVTVTGTNDVPVVSTPTPDATAEDGDAIDIPAGDAFSDVDGSDDLTFTAAGLPDGVTIDPDTGRITGTLTPDASQNGPFEITVTADDGNGGTVTDTFTLTPSNTAPVAQDDQRETAENVLAIGNVLANDTDGGNDTDALTVSQVDGSATAIDQPVTGSNGGQFTIGEDGGYAFNPGADFDDLAVDETRTTTISYQVSDGQGGVDTATLSVTVTGTNDVPVAVADTNVTTENSSVSGDVLLNDSDIDASDTLTVSQVGEDAANVGQPTAGDNGGQFTVNADGSYDFAPGADFDDLAVGESRITAISYQVSDGQGGVDTATLSVTVTGTNDVPVVSTPTPDATAEDGDAIDIPAGDAFSDVDGSDDLTFTAAGLPDGVTIDPDTGRITGTLTPDASQNGPFEITVTADDGNGGTVTDTFTLTPSNTAPVAQDDAVTVAEKAPASGNVLDNDADGGNDTDALAVSQVGEDAANVGQPTAGDNGGQFTVNADGSYDFAPGADFDDLAVGESRITAISYQVSDGQGGVDTATLSVTVTGTNDVPVVSTPTPDATAEDGDAIDIPAGDAFSDVDGSDDLTFTAAGLPDGVTIDPDTGRITGTLTPDASQNGPFEITVTADDGNGGTVTDTFTLTPSNTAPVAQDDAVTVAEKAPASGNVLDNDADGGNDTDALAVSQVGEDAANVGQPTAGDNGGQFTVNADGSYDFAPGADFDDLAVGESRITAISYQVSDGQGGVDTATLSVTVTGTNDVPVVSTPTPDATAEDGDAIDIPAGDAFSDVDGSDDLTFTAAGLPDGVTIDPDTGRITGTLTPDASQNGPFEITVTADDGNGGTVTDTFTLTPSNTAPVAQDDAVTVAEKAPASGNVLDNDADGGNDTDALAVSQVGEDAANVGQPTAGDNGGQFTVNADGSYDFAPGADFDDLAVGESRITAISYQVSDGQGGVDTATLSVTVSGTNDVPVAVADTNVTTENSSVSGDVLLNDSDIDASDTLTVSQVGEDAANVGQPTAGDNGGQFTVNADGSYDFAPGADFDDLAVGESRITAISYQVSDGQGGVDTATLSVTVTGTNDVPVVSTPTPDATAEDGDAIDIPAGDAFSDVDGSDDLTFTAAGLPDGVTIDPDTGRITGTLTPDASQNGPFEITVTADDGNGGTVTDTFTLTPSNTAPVAQDDAVTVAEKAPASGNVLDNDADGGNDTDALAVSQVGEDAANVGQPTAGDNGGQFTVNADGSYDFAPGADFDDLAVGESRITAISYQVSDGQGGVDTATLSVTVTGTNDVPVVSTPTPDATAEDGDAIDIPAGDAFSDVDGSDDLTFTAAGLPDGVTIDPDTGRITGTLTPDASQNGPFEITVTADDGNGGTVTDTFTLTPSNTAPVAQDDAVTVAEKAPASGNVLDNDADGGNDTDALAVSQVGEDAANVGQPTAGDNGGQFTVNADGSYDFAPGADFDDLAVGESRITAISYQVSDGQGGVDTATLSVTVTGTNDVPVVSTPTPDATAEDGDAIDIPAGDAFSDVDGSDDLTFTAAGLPDGVTIDPDTGRITGTLTPDASQNGPFEITVTADDGNGGTVTDTFTLTPSNTAPVAQDDAVTVAEKAPASGNVLDNDADGGNDTDALAVSQVGEDAANVGQPTAGDNGGQFTVNADGSYDFAPGADFDDLAVGESRITAISYQVSDGQGGVDTATLSVTVTGTNDVPVVSTPTPDATAEDGDAIDIPAGDAFSDVDGSDDLTFTAAGLPDGVTIDPDTGRITGTLTPDASQNGPFEITVTADDGNGGTVTDTFTLTPSNTAPVAQDDAVTVAEKAPASGNVLDNDADGGNDTDALAVSQVGEDAANVGQPTAGDNGGQFTVNADGSYDFAPGADFDDLAVGESRITAISYQVSDGQGGVDTATLSVTVTGTNDVPVVSTPTPDATAEDGDAIDIPAGDAFSDVDGSDDLTFTAAGLPDGVTIDPDTGRITGTLTPDASQNGPFEITVTADDGNGGTVTDTFTLTPSNTAPVAQDDAVTVAEKAPASGNVLDNDADGGNDTDALAVSQVGEDAANVGQPTAGDNGGQFTVNADGSYDFAPGADFDDLAVGESRITAISYQVSDGQGGVDTATLSVTVTGTNDVPVVSTPTPDATAEDGDAIDIPAGDAFSDVDGSDDLTFTAAGLPDGVTIDPDTGRITGTLTPDASQNGPFEITVTADDGNGGTVTDTFTLTPSNTAPVAQDDAVTVAEKAPASGNVLDNDADGGNDTDALAVSQVGEDAANVGQPTAGDNGGQFTVNADGSYDFAPGADFDDLAVGESRITAISYQVSDGQGGVDTATLSVTVTGTNDVPVVSTPTPDATAEDGDAIDIPAGDAFSDVDGSDDLTFTAAGLPDGVTIDPDTGRITGTLTPDASQNGPFEITVTADDGNGGTVTDTFTLTPSNTAPVAQDDAVTVAEKAPASGNVLDNDADGGNDTDALAVSQVGEDAANVGQPTAGDNGGQFTVNADGSYDFAPGADFDDLAVGESRITAISYQVSDGQGGVDTATLSVTVTGTNDVPVVSTPTPDATAEDGDAIDIPAGDAFSDVDGSDDLTFTAAGLPDGVTIDPDTGRITGTLTPDASQNGPFEITVTADDGNGGTVTDTFTLTPSNTAPVAQDDAVTVAEKAPASGNVLDNDADGGNDTDALAVSQVGEDAANVGQPTAGDNGGQFTVNADGSYDFAPGADFDDLAVGESRITAISYQVSDGQGGVDTATLSVTVTGTNDVPVVSTPTPDATAEDGDAIDIPAGDAFSDVDGSDDLTFTAAGLPDGVTIDPDTGRITGTLTPDASQNGPFEITVTADDGNGGTVTDTFTLTPSNTAPVAQDDAVTVAEKAPASGNVLDNDADGGNDTDALAVSQVGEDAANVGQPTAGDNGGQFTVNADGSYDFAPGADFDDLAVGESRITAISYQVSDGQGGVDTATLSVTVTGTNDVPVVSTPTPDATAEDGDAIDIPAGDAFSDVDGSDDLTFTAAGLPDGVTIDPDTGRITGTLTPDASQNGPFEITVTADDGNGGTVTDTFTLTPSNTAPVAQDDAVTVAEKAPASGNVLDNDADGGNDTDALAVSQVGEDAANVGQPTAGDNGGQFTVNADGSYDFAPGADFDDLAVGESRITAISYQVSDGQGGVDTATLSVTVTGTNDVPVVSTPTPDATAEDGDAIDIPAGDAFSDVDGSDDLTFTAAGLPDGVTIDPDTGRITGTLTPDASQNGPFEITVTADDGNGGTVTDTFTLTPSNTAPVAQDDAVTVAEKAPASGNVLDNDADGGNDTDALAVSQVGEDAANVGQPTAGDNGGQFTVNADGSYDFAPGADFDDLAVGESRITAISYQVSDGQGGVDTATLSVTVTGTNDVPVVSTPTPDATAEDGDAIDIPAGDAFSDVDGSDDLTFTAAGLPDGVTIDPDTGRITGTLTPDASQNGPFEITVTADDGNGGTVTDTFTLTPSNTAPVAQDDAVTVAEKAPASGNVLDNDADGGNDTDALAVSQVGEDAANVGQPTAGDNGGQFTVNADGSYDFAPGADFDDLAVGESRITAISYQVSDGQGGVDTATLSVTVTGTDDAPVVVSEIPDRIVGNGGDISIPAGEAFADTDASDELTYSATGLPEGLAIDPSTGQITGQLALDASLNAPYAITVTADDGNGGAVSYSFTLTVPNEPLASPGTTQISSSFVPDNRVTDPYANEVLGADGVAAGSDAGQEQAGGSDIGNLDNFLRAGAGVGLTDIGQFGLPEGMTVRYQGTQTDGSPLPGTLTVEGSTGQLSGKLPPGMERARITVIGIDEYGNTKTREVLVDANGRVLEEREDQVLYRRLEISMGAQGTVEVVHEENTGNDMHIDRMSISGTRLTITLNDPRAAEVARYEGSLGNGSALPDGVRIDPQTGDITGDVAGQGHSLDVRIVAVSGDGTVRILSLDIALPEGMDTADARWQSLDQQAEAALAEAGDNHQEESLANRLARMLQLS